MGHDLPPAPVASDPGDRFCRLDGLRGIVTGASSGIGRAIAAELLRGGAEIVVHGRRPRPEFDDWARAAAATYGRRVEVLWTDLADEATHAPLIARVWALWEGCDFWINNAGADLLTGPESRWDFEHKLARLWEVDVRATLHLSKEVGQRMKRAGRGVILNLGWDQADRGMEGDSGELFAAAKNAIMGFTRSLACSLAPEVRVNCIAPGWIQTAWGTHAGPEWQARVLRETPLRRWGTPQDIAYLARFLISPEAGYITGQVINANGGAVR